MLTYYTKPGDLLIRANRFNKVLVRPGIHALYWAPLYMALTAPGGPRNMRPT